MAFSRTHALVMTAPDDPVFENNPSDWNEAHSVSGANVGGIPYCPTATTETTSANLLYTETSGPRLVVGSGTGTSTGLEIGYTGSSGWGGIWGIGVATKNLNAASFYTQQNGSVTGIQASASVDIAIAGTTRIQQVSAAGAGPTFTMGTATTDVGLRATQTWNASGVTFTGIKYTITDTASAAGSLAMQILGGASGTTSLFKVTKGGKVDAPAYAVGGTDGLASFNGAVTNLTVVNGIVTAAS